MQASPAQGGTVIVLGAAVWPGGTASPAFRRRVGRGVALWRSLGADALVISGGVGRHAPSEAEIGGRLARQSGVPAASVVEERAARSTLENLTLSFAAFPDGPPTPIYVVSDWYHLPRAYLAARLLGQPVRVRAVAPPSRPRLWLRQGWNVLREVAALGPTLVQAWRYRRDAAQR